MLNEEDEADAITASIIDDDEEEEIFEINHDKPVLSAGRKNQSWKNYNWCGKFLKTLGLSAAFLALVSVSKNFYFLCFRILSSCYFYAKKDMLLILIKC